MYPPVQLTAAGTLAVSVVGTIVTSTTLQVGQFNDDPPKLQPAGGAFGIWLPIFVTSLAYAGHVATSRVPPVPALLMAAAYAFSTGWCVLVSERLYGAAAGALGTSAVLGLASAATTATPEGATQWLLVELPHGLLAGWLTLAATISTVIAAKAHGYVDSGWEIVAPAVVGAAVASTFEKPLVLLPLVWALAFSRPSAPSGVATSLAIAGVLAASRRALL